MPAFKQHIGLYPPISGDNSIEKATGRYAGPKGDLQFPLDEPMPYSLLERIVKLQVKQDNEKAAKRKKGKQVRGQLDAIPGRPVLKNLPRRP